MKRVFDVTAALFGLLLAAPILMAVMAAIWLYDFASPFYVARRVGRGGRVFRMVKLRSMVINADKIGGASTAEDDPRITLIGRLVRKFRRPFSGQYVGLGRIRRRGWRTRLVHDVIHAEKRSLF